MNQSKNKKNLGIIIGLIVISIFFNLPSSFSYKNQTFHRPNPKIGSWQPLAPKPLQFGLDLAGGASLTFDVNTQDVPSDKLPQALEALRSNIERRVNLFGLSEANIQTISHDQSYRLIIELPGIEDLDQAIELVGQTAQLKFKGEANLPPEATASATFDDVFSQDIGLDGSHLQQAFVSINTQNGQPQVNLEFSSDGAQIFKQATETFLGKRIAILLDDTPITFPPTVQSVIPDGQAVITGNFDNQTAKALASQLNAGALPLSIKLVEQHQIGATLGQESINKGVRAGLIGLGLVCFFMIGNYGWLGLVSAFSLAVYTLLSLTLYRTLPVVLTFPGIVGFILSIGMAVDSNILIFERFKEEKRLGKNLSLALESAFGRAWDSIKDANICTIITAFILFNPLGWSFLPISPLVRGFAATLLLGILVGLFTGVFVTRTLLRLIIKS